MGKSGLCASTVQSLDDLGSHNDASYLLSAATSDVIHQAQFALDVKRQVLPLYEQVFDIEYPLPKLDTLVVSVTVYLGPSLSLNRAGRQVTSTQVSSCNNYSADAHMFPYRCYGKLGMCRRPRIRVAVSNSSDMCRA